MMKIKLHWKLTAMFCSAILLGLVVSFLFISSQLRAYLDLNLENNLKRSLALGRYLLETHVRDSGGIADADVLAHQIGQQVGVRVTIVALDGRVVGDSDLEGRQLPTLENHAGRPEIRQALKYGFGASKRYSYTLKRYLMYAAVPFGGDHPQGALRFAIPINAVELFETQLIRIVGMALLVAFLLSLGITFLLSIWVSRPLREMAIIAQAMAKGDFSRKPSITSRDEMGEMARALTYMSEEIRSKIEHIRREGERLDTVLSSMSEGVVVVDESGVILLMNPSIRKTFFVDLKPEGRRPAEVIRNTAVLELISRLLSGKDRIVREEVTLNSPEEKIFQINGVSIVREGRFEGAVLVLHDISELRRLEKIRQDFVANVSHELRTPVSSIKGYSETLLEGALDDRKSAREFIGIIHDSSDRLASLINDLLDLSKIESGKMQMVFLPVSILPVVNKCLGILDKVIAKKSLKVTVDISPDIPKVNGDEARISQVMLNLMDNAVKYTPEGGQVRILGHRQDGSIRIDVEDSGVGIPEQDLPRIFERFYRVDKARSRDQGGTGLGLSIVKHIVHAHHGEVFVQSEQGRGSVFSIVLPLA